MKKLFLLLTPLLISVIAVGQQYQYNVDLAGNLPNQDNTGFEYKFLYSGIANCANDNDIIGTTNMWGDIFGVGGTGFKNGYAVVYDGTLSKFKLKTDGINNSSNIFYARLPKWNCNMYDGIGEKLDLSSNRTIQVSVKSTKDVTFEIWLCAYEGGLFTEIDGSDTDPRTVTSLSAGRKNVFTITNPTHMSDGTDKSSILSNIIGFAIKVTGGSPADLTLDFLRFGASTNPSQDCNSSICTDPIVSITTPATGSTFPSNSLITFSATASDPDGTVSTVEYFDGLNSIGSTNLAPYSNKITLGPGTHTITAVATDNDNISTTSAPITITVANQNPQVLLDNPSKNSSFSLGSTVTMNAEAYDPDGTISKVEFYDGTDLIGEDLIYPYSFSTTGLSIGTRNLTAKAIDNLGGFTISDPVTIIITNAANQHPAVSITTPIDQTSVLAGTFVQLTATATDPDGTVSKVEFYDGSTYIGQDLNAPYTISIASIGVGSHVFTAIVTDNEGSSTQSSEVIVNANPTSVTSGKLNDQLVNVFPIPAKDQITIDVSKLSINGTGIIKLMDPTGKIVKEAVTESSFYVLDLDRFNKGIYMIEVVYEDKIAFKRIIIE